MLKHVFSTQPEVHLWYKSNLINDGTDVMKTVKYAFKTS